MYMYMRMWFQGLVDRLEHVEGLLIKCIHVADMKSVWSPLYSLDDDNVPCQYVKVCL